MVFVIHWQESAMDLHVFPIPIPPPISLSTQSLWVFAVHQAQALVSCIQPGLVICFTLDNIHVSMLISFLKVATSIIVYSPRYYYIHWTRTRLSPSLLIITVLLIPRYFWTACTQQHLWVYTILCSLKYSFNSYLFRAFYKPQLNKAQGRQK